ncbi:MAG: spondin domain-containing protein [Pseudomonadota bacterium]
MTDLRISVRNTSDTGGTFLTPFYFGFHDEGFDLFNVGEEASPGLEALAEDGDFGALAGERSAASPDSQGLVVAGEAGPIATQEFTSNRITVDGTVNNLASFGAMILPSNDAFVGTSTALTLFDDAGMFTGAQTVVLEGSNVYDAGTEVNTELDAAFINQTAPDTGVDENGVIRLHPGFNGSEGNPDGEGDQIILGGTNAFGVAIDPVAGDFTLPGAQIAVVHVNTVEERQGTDSGEVLGGNRSDNIINAGDGQDILLGRRGWDELNGEGGGDIILGGSGDDLINGGGGRDWISGGRDNDIIDGGRGADWINGNRGDDVVAGGLGEDTLTGGSGDDLFVYVAGDGDDLIRDFDRNGDDQLAVDVDGIDTFADLLATAEDVGFGVEFDFGDGDSVLLRGVDLDTLTETDFVFG